VPFVSSGLDLVSFTVNVQPIIATQYQPISDNSLEHPALIEKKRKENLEEMFLGLQSGSQRYSSYQQATGLSDFCSLRLYQK